MSRDGWESMRRRWTTGSFERRKGAEVGRSKRNNGEGNRGMEYLL